MGKWSFIPASVGFILGMLLFIIVLAESILSIFLTVNFGIATGCAIFIAQFYGKKDEKNHLQG